VSTYRAKEPFAFTDVNGVPRSVVPGDLFDGDDPNLKGKLGLFEPVETAAARAAGVEDASAEPGSLRSVSTKRRGRKVAPEPDPEPAEPEAPVTPAETE
jgi:hypothetical protein